MRPRFESHEQTLLTGNDEGCPGTGQTISAWVRQWMVGLLLILLVVAIVPLMAVSVSSLLRKHCDAWGWSACVRAALPPPHPVLKLMAELDQGANSTGAGPISPEVSETRTQRTVEDTSNSSKVQVASEQPSVADTISALALVIAVVTLVLTWGASWIHTKGVELDKQLQRVRSEMSHVSARLQGLAKHRHALQLWSLVVEELAYRLREETKNPTDLATYLSFAFLGLLAEQEEERFKSFRRLRKHLEGVDSVDLPHACAYMKACHELAEPSGKGISFTRIFSRIEVAAFEERLLMCHSDCQRQSNATNA